MRHGYGLPSACWLPARDGVQDPQAYVLRTADFEERCVFVYFSFYESLTIFFQCL